MAPSTGVDTLTGEGLDDALQDSEVVVDVSNSPSFADEPVMTFFRTSTTNLLTAGPLPYSIVRSTQFFEFLPGIADAATVGDEIRLADATLQPLSDVLEDGDPGTR